MKVLSQHLPGGTEKNHEISLRYNGGREEMEESPRPTEK
jgi:hypothetical protein